jgi:hypothetical protein
VRTFVHQAGLTALDFYPLSISFNSQYNLHDNHNLIKIRQAILPAVESSEVFVYHLTVFPWENRPLPYFM